MCNGNCKCSEKNVDSGTATTIDGIQNYASKLKVTYDDLLIRHQKLRRKHLLVIAAACVYIVSDIVSTLFVK